MDYESSNSRDSKASGMLSGKIRELKRLQSSRFKSSKAGYDKLEPGQTRAATIATNKELTLIGAMEKARVACAVTSHSRLVLNPSAWGCRKDDISSLTANLSCVSSKEIACCKQSIAPVFSIKHAQRSYMNQRTNDRA
ncbi:hypothetical protein EVAR_17133_1 [Eumeta japonica]|uniref:Uncharacterized protein n=1 Tax=Eumeta variegata TaxID=151549 RepID=A0A4C1ULW3_EUMVA|nr:hypothetical protein EVAR_17133_1 [Eumeta japonica]